MGSLWNRSGTVERQDDDIRAAGARAWFYEGFTTTLLTVYADAAESSAYTNPVEADANGRWPDVFVPYITGYDVYVETSDGVQLSNTHNIPNPDPVEVTVTAPTSQLVSTGMIHGEFINGTKAGYVRLNGRTIGNAVSGATERANADCSDLFIYLWNNLTDTVTSISGGRGASGAADFAANKRLTLPSTQGCMFIGIDDMGDVAQGNFGSLSFVRGNATTVAGFLGVNEQILSVSNMPAHSHVGSTSFDGDHNHGGATGGQSQSHTHSGTTDSGGAHTHGGTTDSAGTHHHTVPGGNNVLGGLQYATSGASNATSTQTSDDGAHTHTFTTNSDGSHTHTFTTGNANQDHTHSISASGTHQHTFSTDTVGGGAAFNNLPFSYLVTWFIKL